MTDNEFYNYKANIKFHQARLANEFANFCKTNDEIRMFEYEWKLKFLMMYDDMLCRWQLETYEEDEDDYTYNHLKPSEMQCLAQLANSICGTSFCVDFYKNV